MTTASGAMPATLPSVSLITEPRATLEMISIAAGVFALVVSLLWLDVPSEAMWLPVCALTAKRRYLMERGLDLVLDDRSKRPTKIPSREVSRG